MDMKSNGNRHVRASARGPLSWTRRDFLKGAAATAAGVIAAPTIITSTALGSAKRSSANERINMGVIGCGERGCYVMKAFLAQPDTHVVAVCDVFRPKRLLGQEIVNTQYGNRDCAAYVDFLELLARPDIDAVLIATGDNWHSGVSIMAARAGKDIYCEKPLSVTLMESRAVSDEMKRLGRIFQCGTQRRSVGHFIFAVNLARSGKLGRIKEMQAEQSPGWIQGYDTILPEEPEPQREEFDWNRWLGPAAWRPYNGKYQTRGFWSGHWDFSGASIAEWGSHTVDLCQWANNSDDTGPVEFWREEDRFLAKYASGVRLVIRNGLRFGSCPIRIEGEEGYVETGDSGEMEVYPKSLLGDRKFLGGYPPDDHARAFLDCVKTRQQTISNAEVAHRSISVCHLANICKRLDRPVKWDPATERCIDDPQANRMLSRAYREPWYL
jgi:predicted dehydrogenase